MNDRTSEQAPTRRRWPELATPLTVLVALAAALMLVGCATPGHIESKAKLHPPTELGSSAAVAPLGTTWWTAFNQPELNALVDRALADSPDLRAAQARIDLAAAGTAGARAAAGPRIDGDAEITRQHFTANGLYPPPLAGANVNSGNLQATFSWELDFFGRHRAELAAALGEQRSAEAEREAVRLGLASAVARNYIQLARLVDQQALAQRTLAQRESLLKLIRERVDAGLDTNVELRQGEGSIPDARAQIEALAEQMALTRHTLAVLTSQPPAALDALAPHLQPVQAVPLPAGLPLELLGQRPDITAARWRVEAATQDVQVARTRFYPNINLVAMAGLNAFGLGNVLEASSRQWSVGPALTLPIFDAGRLRANLRGKTAELDAAVESYNGAVLGAARETADRISSAQSIERQQREQAAAQAAAESAYDLAVQRYRAGIGSYLTVLTAETSVISQRRAGADLKARALDTQVALAHALGGGYTADAKPVPVATAAR